MDSLSLSTLQDSLPAANLVNAEKDLLNSFKAAALSITTLYRSSRHTSKRAYNAGYTSACQDLLLMIQHGVSDAGPSAAPGNGGMDVGRVMDWVEARLSAIRAREEEEDEDEERERAGAGLGHGSGPKATSTPAPKARRRTSPPPQPTPSSHQHRSSSPTPVPFTPTATPIMPVSSSSRSNTNTNTIATPISAPRTFKARAPSSIALPPTPVLDPLPIPVSDTVSVGQKRRHALVSMLDTGSSGNSALAFSAPATPSGSVPGGLVRRRTRHSIRGGSALALGPSAVQNQIQGQGQGRANGEAGGVDSMDVEEDSGRERKRVARR